MFHPPLPLFRFWRYSHRWGPSAPIAARVDQKNAPIKYRSGTYIKTTAYQRSVACPPSSRAFPAILRKRRLNIFARFFLLTQKSFLFDYRLFWQPHTDRIHLPIHCAGRQNYRFLTCTGCDIADQPGRFFLCRSSCRLQRCQTP